MTSERQVAANRRNARKSTGPRTEAGRARSSGNARRHGLTGALPPDAIVHCYRLLLDNPDAVPDPLTQDPRLRAALRLAEAEVRLARVRTVEADWFSRAVLTHTATGVSDRRAAAHQRSGRDPAEMRAQASQEQDAAWSELRRLGRYRDEAEVARLKALRAWRRARKKTPKRTHFFV